jgi:hypothetical protein
MKIHLLSPIAVAVLLGACGGSSSDSPAAASTTTASGRAVDGYLSGSTVTCDANANGVADTGETATTTSNLGAYSFVCDTNIDTNLPFKGRLLAPSGSAVITPLTGLVVQGLTPAKVAEVLGLPAGTDVTKLDPALQTGGVYVNQALFQKTLAVQHLIQQTSEVIFTASGGSAPSAAALQAQYAEIAKAVAGSLTNVTSAAPLISSSGTVSSDAVKALVTASVSAIKASTDASLATVKAGVANLDAARVATFAAPTLVTQAGTLSTATGDGLAAAAKSATSDTVLTTMSGSVATNGGFGASSTIDLASVATATNDAAILGVIDEDTRTSLQTAGLTTLPAVTVVDNYFAIADNRITLGQSTPNEYTLEQLKAGTITLVGPTSPTDDLFNISFTLNTTGAPITTVTSELGFELKGTGADQRIFRFIIDKVNLTLSGSQVTATVPTDAVLTVFARKADGVSEIEVSTTNLASNTFSTSANVVTFNAQAVVAKILTQANSQTSSFFTKLLDSTGTFALTGVLSNNVPIRTKDAHLLSIGTVTIGGKSVGGPSVSGNVTIN